MRHAASRAVTSPSAIMPIRNDAPRIAGTSIHTARIASWRRSTTALAGATLLGLVAPGIACEGPRTDTLPPAATASPEGLPDSVDGSRHEPLGGDAIDPAAAARDPSNPTSSPSTPTPPDEKPREATPEGGGVVLPAGAIVLRSTRDVVVRQAPQSSAPLVGIIARARSFVAWELTDGPGCKGQWARLEHGGHACLSSVSPSTDPASSLPVIPEGSLVPFLYVEARDDEKPLPVWRSVQALLRGDPPMVEHAGNSRLAFESTKVFRSVGRVFLDDRGRAISRDLVRVLQPSTFEGRDLVVSPPSPNGELGWMLDTLELRESPRESARATGTLRKHTQLSVKPRDRESSGTQTSNWHFVLGTDESGHDVSGWVPVKHVRVWTPPPPLDDVGRDETWIDVESSTQLLTLMRGTKPVFATLVSTGKAGDRTPPGVYRIRMKHAWGTMRSLPGADEPYRVEGVPWAQYFHQRYALHGVYWHNGFGRPASHGCVNLSPKDARRVFEATNPEIPAGWRSVHETPEHVGTVVRIRRGEAPTPDRRKELERLDDEAPSEGEESLDDG